MSTKEKFDDLIKSNLIKVNPQINLGFYGNGLNLYDNYISFGDFIQFLNNMTPNQRNAFMKAFMKELAPPKMASVASSSRFCFLGLKDADIDIFGYPQEKNGNFEFEKQLPININQNPQPQANLDAYYNGITTDFYFEFKCHELFDSHKISDLNSKYDNAILVKIDPNIGNLTSIDCRRFDAKQFITHLAGIDNNCLGKGRKIVLSYVYFYPTNMTNQMLNLFQDLETEISKVFNDQAIQKYCKANNITLNYYRFENDVMDGFEKHPGKLKLILSV